MRKILLVLIGLSVSAFADFSRDAGTKIVTDNDTKIEYKDDAIGSTMNWQNAINHCENLSYNNHNDWRLPNITELLAIVDETDSSAPTIEAVFENTASDNYWSSTTHASNTSYAWYVNFDYGHSGNYRKSVNYYVRCVRAGQ